MYVIGRTIKQGDVSLNSRLFINGDVSINSRLFVNSDVSLNARLFVSSDSSFNGNMYVIGRNILQGDVSLNSRLFINGDVSMNSRLFVNSDVSLNARLFVSGDSSFNGNMYVIGRTINQGDVSINSRLFISGDASLNSRLFVYSTQPSSSYTNGALTVAGGAGIAGNAYINGNIYISSGSSIIIGGTALQSGASFVGGTITADTIFQSNARLYVTNDVSMLGNLYTGNRTIHQGDVSINSRLFINGDVSMNSRLFVSNDVSLNARLFVSGDSSFNGNMYVIGRTIHQGDVSINSRLFVGNDVTLFGRLNVYEYSNNNIIYTNVSTTNYTLIIAEDLSLNGRLNVYKDASFSGNLFVNGTNNYINSKLGVGTTSPLSTIDIITTYASTDSYSGGLVVRNISNSANQSSSILASIGGSNAANTYFATDVLGSYGFSHGMSASSSRYSFKSNYNFTGTEVMTLLANGNVGIGNQSPSYTLDITGNTRVNQSAINSFSLLSYNSTNAVNTMFFVPYLGAGGFNSITAANDTGIFWGNTSGSATGGLVIAPWSTGPNGIRMDKNGNVGIGLSVPGCALDVNGTIRIANGSSFTSTGDIRFTTPSSNTIYINNDKTSGDVRFNYAGGVLNSSSALRFYGSDGTYTTKENFTILNNGNVGLGYASPSYTLDLNGSFGCANASVFSARNTSGTGENYLWPRWSDNAMYLNYGSAGFNIRNNSSTAIMTMNNAGAVTINQNIASTSTSTGSLVVTGGVGVAGNVNVAGDTRVVGKLYIGTNDPGGGGGDTAYLEYVAISGESTTLRIVSANDPGDNINLMPGFRDSATGCMGNVGIGKDSPSYKLDVNGNVNATSYNASSDIRIKKNIININGTFAVDVLRKLEPKKYSFIDTNKENEYTWGFIGQEIANIFDYATTQTKECIPNICDYADVSNNTIIKLKNKLINDFLLKSLTDTSLCKVRLLIGNKKTEIIRTIYKIIDDKSFSVTEPITENDLSGNTLFVYGQYVDDFYSVNYTSVFTITTAAVKEIDKELQNALSVIEEQNKTIKKLEDDVDELKAMVKLLMNK
jgi:hypothetical protein